MSPLRSDHIVLVVAGDALLAALIGILIEGTSFKVAFPLAGERTEDALARVKPLAAVLLDADAGEVASDVFVRRARNRGVAVILFGGRENLKRLEEWAGDAAVPSFVLPDEIDALRDALRRIPPLESERAFVERSDRRGIIERAADGHLVFFDRAGRRWSVYDRRGSDRRQPLHRRFVSDQGQVMGCDLPAETDAAPTADALERQLAQATPESV